jgi:hypothetical protein
MRNSPSGDWGVVANDLVKLYGKKKGDCTSSQGDQF